ncbi:N-acetylmuramoyl-L-alanine amidase [Coraliomargarita sp. SDUM461004]|uniref:N-acetylmuramoyl-L-alanine amidase n=1 Tax=Thalassobacterium sedimentorum TaxID=3041258 RepID=A0ABU1AEK7_9BACT|nr:N-acetylmuramoyl-L-alanine amidase [Coraliomargarita sp. SDUM461004]MDQ8193079.1 N-acetylmuramoyl-L-alanine amidase [Coraliomargarita sp. SDUM461004]
MKHFVSSDAARAPFESVPAREQPAALNGPCRRVSGIFSVLCLLSGLLSAQSTPEQLAYMLSTRYTPYIEGTHIVNVEQLATQEVETWWTSPAAMRRERISGAHGSDCVLEGQSQSLPLSGLHLALDPGHVGGVWAHWEWRDFRIAETDHWVREGELVLEVAQRIRNELVRLGAQVTLLRETCQPVNPKRSADYWAAAAAQLTPPTACNLQAQVEHALAVRNRAVRLAIVTGELAERARVVNEELRPDVLLSLHINAAAWPPGPTQQLVDSNHVHVLVFGCLSESELATAQHQTQLARKMLNGSGGIEAVLGAALGRSFGDVTGLPPSDYQGLNAIRIDAEVPYLWARNLMLLRQVECPTVLLEPYVANSEREYKRIQQALIARACHEPLPADDILVEYATAVVRGVLQAYGPVDWPLSQTGH